MKAPAAHEADVLVVGAGPAGSATAVRLRRLGLSVVLADKARFPRHKICGDFLSPGAVAEIGAIGVRLEGEATTARLEGMRITFGGRTVLSDFPPARPAIGVSRHRLDALLVRQAQRAGATLLEGLRVVEWSRDPDGRHRVSGVHPDGTTRAFVVRLVVEAGGRFGLIGRRLAWRRDAWWPRRWALWSHMENVAGLAARCEMHVFEGGYVGVAPIDRDGSANVTMVLDARRWRAARRDPAAAYRHHLAAHAELSRRLAQARRLTPVRGLGPLACRARRLSGDGIALVGDACGFVDPFTGEGVGHALGSAALLAGAVRARLAEGGAEGVLDRLEEIGGYARAWRARYAQKMTLCRWLQIVIANPRLASHVARALEARRDLADAMVGATGDLLPASSILNPSYLGRLLLAGMRGGIP